jgi:hypothetical protein
MTAHLDDLLHDEAEPAGSRVPALDGRRLSMQEQAQALAADTWRAAWRRFRKACEHPGGFVHGLMSQKPPSVTEQVAYAEAKQWVTAGHDGGIADVAGTLYQRFAGVNGVAYHDAMAGLYAKPFRLAVALMIFAVFSVPVVMALGWLPWLALVLVLRVIVFPLAVTALRPKGVSK